MSRRTARSGTARLTIRHVTFEALQEMTATTCFNTALSQLDLFVAEAISQCGEHDTGVWRSGLDAAAQDALNIRERKS
jgi:hypothetical protein